MALLEHQLLSRVFRTLGDPTRLQLLETLLSEGESTQSELPGRVEDSQPVSPNRRTTGPVSPGADSLPVDATAAQSFPRIVDQHAGDFLDLACGFVANNGAAVGCFTVFGTDH